MAACIRDQGEWVCGVVGAVFVRYETAFCGVYFTRWGLGSRAECCCSKFVPALFAAYDGVLLPEGESVFFPKKIVYSKPSNYGLFKEDSLFQASYLWL